MNFPSERLQPLMRAISSSEMSKTHQSVSERLRHGLAHPAQPSQLHIAWMMIKAGWRIWMRLFCKSWRS